jgi:putative ABC transport system permease protein
MKIPLAWLQLTHERIRLLVALAGIGFADLLMFMQLGFQNALFDSGVTLHKSLRGDIFLISSESTALIAMKSFSRRRLYQALGVEGVESVSPIYHNFALWKNPVNRSTRSIQVIGFNPKDNLLDLPNVESQLQTIQMPDTVLFDDLSREEFGPIAELYTQGNPVVTEVGTREIRVDGLFSLGASFGADGNLVTSDLNFLRLFPERSEGLIEFGAIQLEEDADLETVLQNLRQKLPEDVYVYSKVELIQHEQNYWRSATSIGFVFSLGTAMGFLVGTVIVYQILYTDVADHLPEYATLKAMGYTDFYLLKVVFQEALILSLIGFIPGVSISSVLYLLARNATGLPMMMTVTRAINVLILTVIMCCVSGAVAVRKLSAADPADIF